MEIELKYKLSDESLDKLEHFQGPVRAVRMQATYYDTEDFLLRSMGIGFRIRLENGEPIATIKWSGGAENGLHIREEANFDYSDEEGQKDAQNMLFNLLGKRVKLKALFTMDFDRLEKTIDIGNGNMAVISTDRGFIKAVDSGKTCEIHELELELMGEGKDELKAFGKALEERFNIEALNTSKLERAFDLL